MKQAFLLFLLSSMMLTCKKADICNGVLCKNGGTCVTGDCDCPIQWTGPDCSQQKTPSVLALSSVTVTKFPATDTNGAGWDLTSGPDVYIEISQNNTVLYTSNYVTNASQGVTFNTGFILPNVTGIYTIRVFDHDDLDPDDYIGGIQGLIYSSTNNFPQTLSFTCATCDVEFTIPLIYNW